LKNLGRMTIADFEKIAERRRLSIYEDMLYTQLLIAPDPDPGPRQIRLRFKKTDGILWDDNPEDRADDDIDDELRGTADELAERALAMRARVREVTGR
jgi:hypothetical protein